ncbi:MULTISPECIES: MHYT domain-containing protein [Bradyrhizobium]|uniref:NO-binding membrane sensor protein with MHYT domain n=2 Tax=Pseudomonadota TaxID=1224 RepID=A0ABV2RMJ4_BRAJP|nr:MHYT domain-containing protein [Bradyrhizobium japonicum]AJA60532.1 carbon monoxide dehydrogenase [Bradyrhizobium japonicum]KMJ99984.1 carbon monoxide dehydrogenase [Bradyrhizobium japonicum]MBR0763031.1 LytTR family transcriptional regulator DNA-binding domain-containing protein [Bradyrhizobium japonicum]MCP1762868.1 NO-binding membrane sensor protein with MHYT domain [Bradyrhizobium japonicum]MCP1785002.1 NO-binding membrane sensor protein with MHYT domain [Bradyrhizobium japonicum]
MFEGHDPYLVALSVAIASLGGYTGFALAARIRNTPGVSNRVLLAGAAAFLAVGIWTMHFVGMLAAPLPPDTVYLVLPTIISFLICALVVGISLFFVSIGEPSLKRVASSAVLLGVGIASMHYVGIHGLAGHFGIVHDRTMVLLSVVVAIVTAYGGLRAFLAQQEGIRLIVSSVAFGIAVSGMHYTAMLGMHFEPLTGAAHHHAAGGLAASQQILSIVVAVLCFVIAAGFLLSLVPDQRRQTSNSVAAEPAASPVAAAAIELIAAPATAPRPVAPLGGLGQPPRAPVPRLPVESADGTHFIETANVRSVRADAHYTRVHDGTRERMCPWSISEAEAQLDPSLFLRVHRSHIVAIPHVALVRREGDGAVLELDGPSPHRVPVSRAKIAEVKARLGLANRRQA